MRTRSAGAALAVVLAVAACSGDDAGRTTDARATAIPSEPAACAGPPREGLEDVYEHGWAAARSTLLADPSAEVWLGFSRILSPADVADLLAPLTVHGILLVVEQQQGTYLKTQTLVADVAADDPALEQEARALVARDPLRPPVSLPGIPEGATDPVDRAAVEAAPPIAVLLVSGDVAGVLEREPCLVHSMSPGSVDSPAQISPAIEPDPVRFDEGYIIPGEG